MKLNLATKPFVNRRRFYVLTTMATITLTVVLLVVVTTFIHNFRNERGIRRQIAAARAEVERLQDEQAKLEEALIQPASADVIDRTEFLNSLIRQKSVSWTRIFMDLEKVMPDRVQTTSLHPTVLLPGKEGKNKNIKATINGPLMVDLQMTVRSEKFDNLLELLRHMEQSQNFRYPVLYTENGPKEGPGEKLWDLVLSVNYAQ